jgi:hypothetical protein
MFHQKIKTFTLTLTLFLVATSSQANVTATRDLPKESIMFEAQPPSNADVCTSALLCSAQMNKSYYMISSKTTKVEKPPKLLSACLHHPYCKGSNSKSS